MKREEISAFIRNAGRIEVEWAKLKGLTDVDDLLDDWDQAAFQVENMWCETCEHQNKTTYTSKFGFNHGCPWRDCGGCFNYEPKVK